MFLVLSMILFLLPPYSGAENGDEFCPPTRCSPDGPEIRYPFRLKTQPLFCGQEGFELSCSDNKTLLHLPFSGDYYVQEIGYHFGSITIVDVQETACTIQSLLAPNLRNSRFDVSYLNLEDTIFNCTDRINTSSYYDVVGPISCLSYDRNFVYVMSSYKYSDEILTLNCRKYKTVESSRYLTSADASRGTSTNPAIEIGWKPHKECDKCEGSGDYCGFNTTSNSVMCCKHDNPKFCFNYDRHHSPIQKIVLSIAVSIGGSTLLALVILIVYKSWKSENEKEAQLKVDKFLEDYKTLNPARYSYSDIKKITGKFKQRLGQGGYGSVFKGKFSNGIPVAVKMLEHSKENGEEFINEVATIGRIHHFNIVRLLGFCSEGTRRALIYEFMPNGSLEKFLFSRGNESAQRPLSWEKLQNIAIGIARGVEYLHQGCNQRILHFDIKPHNILLDHNFRPKISDFGLAKLCSKEQSVITMTAARGTAGYIAPELFSRNFGDVSYKSDVFSYGMMLLEMVGCRKNIDLTIENQSQIYFPEWIFNKLSQGKELHLEFVEDEDEEIAKKLAIVGLWCIQWNPIERPSMPKVLQMLEGDLQSLEMPPKPFVSSNVEIGAN
ncbi:rust resistance kinase Lr10-like isoform X2 [Mangifera indica]|uniref:rust resistance kinase Lr10-like isoform X2 n=1 Tax=Mangifera indica TaxID=29780 RepID=UPI001CF9997F|nr:rust resistance kinase Lr10-like isoform X2 [Mangifera indica]